MNSVSVSELFTAIAKNQFIYTIFTISLAYIIYLIVIGAIYLIMAVDKELSGSDNIRKKTTLYFLFKNIVKYLMISIILLIILDYFGIDTNKIVAGLGIAGLIIGLALQDVLKDFIVGLFIIIDNQFAVGDVVLINGFKGEVLSLGLKTTRIKSATGEIHSITNRNITEVTNFSTEESIAVVELLLPVNSDISKVNNILNKLLPEIEKIEYVNKNIDVLGVENITELGILYKINIKCVPLKNAIVKRAALLLIKETFDKNKINLVQLEKGAIKHVSN